MEFKGGWKMKQYILFLLLVLLIQSSYSIVPVLAENETTEAEIQKVESETPKMEEGASALEAGGATTETSKPETNNTGLSVIGKRGNATAEDFLEIVKYYEEMLKTNPEAVQAPDHGVLAIAYYNLGRYEEALNRLKKAEILHPNFSRNYALLGITYKTMGRQSEAHEAFLKWADMMINGAQSTQEYWAAWLMKEIVK